MTDQEIIQKVATEVMGWTDFGDENGYYGIINPRSREREIIFTKEDTSFGLGWNPVQNHNHAFLIVEKMRKDGFYPNIIGPDKDENEWYVVFKPCLYENAVVHKNLGTTICLAALKVKGVEV